jgi:hypothetical protein
MIGLEGGGLLMAWKDKASASYTGGSGQMAVMGELLYRKCNAAIPHIDVGTDVFAFRDDREAVARIQVKTAYGERHKKGRGFSARFGVPMGQLGRLDDPPLFYALAVRLDDGWGAFIVVSRTNLQELWNDGCGSENAKSGDLELHIRFHRAEDSEGAAPHESRGAAGLRASCGRFDLTRHLNAWESLPPLMPLADGAPERLQP